LGILPRAKILPNPHGEVVGISHISGSPGCLLAFVGLLREDVGVSETFFNDEPSLEPRIDAAVERTATAKFHVPLFERLFGPTPQAEAVRVLCLDGGGIRGVISAVFLTELTQRTGKGITELFDHIAGTSTGSILTALLTTPHPADPVKPRYTASEVLEGYLTATKGIFALKGLREHVHAANLFVPKYHNDAFNDLLSTMIGEVYLSDCVLDVTIPAYSLSDRDAHLFSSRDAKAHASHDYKLWEVARASSAAPTYFEPHLITNRTGDKTFPLIDGGVVANNPGMCAFADVERHGESRDVVMVSVGTGTAKKEFEWPGVQHWGVAQWARPIFSLLMDASSQAIHFELRHVLGAPRYRRFQVAIPHEAEAIDNVTEENLALLASLGREMIRENDREIDHICELLVR
jgi:uncharacterized protein